MSVVARVPNAWVLLSQGQQLYLEVACRTTSMEFSVLVRLSPAEQAGYRARGHAFLAGLARELAEYWPSTWATRHVGEPLVGLAATARDAERKGR